jgi:hypothetical protein
VNATARTSWLPVPGQQDRHELVVTVPVRTRSETNMREHHMARHRRRKTVRVTVGLVVRGALQGAGVSGPLEVVMTRCAPSNGLDGDNLVSSLKSVRDGVADALGIDDRDPRVTWRCEQRRAKRGDWSVEIRILRGGTVGT